MKKHPLHYLFYTLVISTFLFTSCRQSSSSQQAGNGILFPAPFAFAIDDLGWNTGRDDGDVDHQGPYRIGVDRKMDLNDYKCIVEVGDSVGVRIMGLFILSEMDRENILGAYPTTTWMGKNWDNSANIVPEQKEIMAYVRDHSANLEFGLHGVGHEYWVDGVKKRAEWYNTDDNHPWPEESLEEHLRCYKAILAQYGLSPGNGHSFPESFVPCAYSYHWNPDGDYSTGTLLSKEGIKYANTLFDYIPELNPPAEPNGGGFDHGVLVINRINYGNEWFRLSSLPTVDLDKQESWIIESHWSNWLAQDQFLQEETNRNWVDYYRMVQSSADRYVAKNTEQFYAQWLYKKFTLVSETSKGTVLIDNSAMPAEAYREGFLGTMVLKIKLNPGEHVSKALLDGETVPCYFEDQGYGFIYLPVLEKRSYTLEYETGENEMDGYIFNKGTYNVYSFKKEAADTEARIRLYGTQTVDFFGVERPDDISLSNPDVEQLSAHYDAENRHLALELRARDMQGETSSIRLLYK